MFIVCRYSLTPGQFLTVCVVQVMESLEQERRLMETRFTIHQQDVDKLKEKDVLSK